MRMGPEAERRQRHLEMDRPPYEVAGALERFDERDNVQARYDLSPGSETWKEYYALHPEREEPDLATKQQPGIGMVGDPQDGLLLATLGMAVRMLSNEEVVDGISFPMKQELIPERAQEKVKGAAYFLGADLVRTGPLNPAWVYTHVGKGKMSGAEVGAPIDLPHHHAVTIAVGIDQGLVRTGPVLAEIIGVVGVYQRLALISTTLAMYIRMLGYAARAHNLWDYQVLCVPVAVDAGMGELSRSGLMINRDLGNCLKLAVVTTDLPLAHDRPVDPKVREFCEECRICVDYCPAGAIPRTEPKVVRGIRKWAIKSEACYDFHMKTGTDCGLCMAVCPWTKPLSPSHEVGRRIAVRGKTGAKFLLAMEKLFYGEFKPQEPPSWFEEPDKGWLEDLRWNKKSRG
jgi:ferredoxin